MNRLRRWYRQGSTHSVAWAQSGEISSDCGTGYDGQVASSGDLAQCSLCRVGVAIWGKAGPARVLFAGMRCFLHFSLYGAENSPTHQLHGVRLIS